MKNNNVKCRCGAIELEITGEAAAQLYCHCDDCQTAHGAAYVPSSLYPAHAVSVVKGEPVPMVVKETPRMRCGACGTFMFSEIEGAGLRGVNGFLLPKEEFKPKFHIQCRYAVLPVVDDLPHYEGFPAAYGGTDELASW